MKKLILSLFILCSILSNAQISIPQVTGLPAALNSKVDKVTGKSLVADTLSAKIQPTATAVATKEPLLPSTPSNPESRFLNGNKQWAEIVLGSGGYASNVYFTNLTSAIVGTYKQTSGTHELTETIASGTCNNNEVLIYTYLFEQPVGIETVDAGVWRFTMNCAINSNVGDSKFKIVQFKRSSTGVETDMFTVYSNTIENRVGYEGYLNNVFETVQPSFTVEATDRLGCRVYATTTASGSRTLSYKVGDGFASYLNTPLVPRHDQFRDKNGNPLYQHLTSAQVAKVDATIGTNTGDETLTSIKTKLGAATAVSDGYLKYQDFALLHTPTTVTAANGLSISGQNISLQNASLTQSGALTFNDWNTFNSKEPSFSKNTAFNKNFGTTTGTVLEGRTFGTAANSAVGAFIQNQNSSAQSANMWISGRATINGNIEVKSGSQIKLYKSDNTDWATIGSDPTVSNLNLNGVIKIQNAAAINSIFPYVDNITDLGTSTLGFKKGYFKGGLDVSGEATFSSTVNSTGFLLNGNNLTSSLTTNYIPKWNGSTFVNATSGTDYQLPITLTTNGTSGAATFSGNVLNVPNYTSSTAGGSYSTTITLLSGLASKSTPLALYTNIGGIKHAALSGTVTTNTTGTCSFRFTLPSSILGNNSIFHVYVFGYTGSYVADAYVTNYGSDSNVDLYFNSASPSGSSFKYSIMVDYD